MTLSGKTTDLNNIKSYVLSDANKESLIDFEDYRDDKWELSKPKEFSHERWTQWFDIIYNYFASHIKIHGVPLSYVIRKDTPITDDRENSDVKIFYQESIFRSMFTRY